MKFEDLKFGPRLGGMAGIQAFAKFPNGYEASIIRGFGSYGADQGLYELAIFCGDDIVYDTPITDDVLGHLCPSDVTEILAQIEALPERAKP